MPLTGDDRSRRRCFPGLRPFSLRSVGVRSFHAGGRTEPVNQELEWPDAPTRTSTHCSS